MLGCVQWCVKIKELILSEEFNNCVPDRVVVYTSLAETATLTDKFVLTHRIVFTPTPLPQKVHPKHLQPPEKYYWCCSVVCARKCFALLKRDLLR